MTFDPKSVEITCVTLSKDPCVQVPWEYINPNTIKSYKNLQISKTRST